MGSTTSKSQRGRGVIECYRAFLLLSASAPVISLGEGNKPLIFCPPVTKRIGRACEVFVKNEAMNPTGSFKDRGMPPAVSNALVRGASALMSGRVRTR